MLGDELVDGRPAPLGPNAALHGAHRGQVLDGAETHRRAVAGPTRQHSNAQPRRARGDGASPLFMLVDVKLTQCRDGPLEPGPHLRQIHRQVKDRRQFGKSAMEPIGQYRELTGQHLSPIGQSLVHLRQ